MSSSSDLPRTARGRRSLALVVSIAVVGCGVSCAIYFYAKAAANARTEAEFSRRAGVRNALTREIIANYTSGLYGLKCLFEGSDSVTRTEFREIAEDIRARYPGITALQWVPVVPAAERERVEQQVSAEVGHAFQFTEPGPNGEMIPARARPEHFPIVFIEPMQGNERAFGYDVKTAPSRTFLERAARTGTLVVSSQFPLVQSRSGIVMIWPVYARSGGERTAEVRGFIEGVFRADEILAQSELRMPALTLDIVYIDDTAADSEQKLLYDPRHLVASADDLPRFQGELRKSLHRQFDIELGGRRWAALYRPRAEWVREQQSHLPELWLAAGLAITGLLASSISAAARRTALTEKVVAERTRELSESRRQLSGLLHTLPGMAVRCVQENDISVIFVSEGARDLTGFTADDLISGKVQFRDLIHPADLEAVRMAVRRALQSRTDIEIEFRLCTADGGEKWVLSRGRGVVADDGQLLFEGLAIDITERKVAEAAKIGMERKLLESKKLESIGLLAGGIAHDFNNLLSGILGHANLARMKIAPDSPAIPHLRNIETGTTRAAELCHQMLVYSGRGQRVVEPVDVSHLVKETLPLVQGSIPAHVQVHTEISHEPTIAMADATQLRQIAMNLIINAADAIGSGRGDIFISTGVRWVDSAVLGSAQIAENVVPGDFVFLEVGDSGCGMSEETLSKIFDPFFTTKFTGRGLGLAAVLGIVRSHSGALHVESKLGHGSTFTLLLPVTTQPLPSSGKVASATPWQRSGKILVIDDEEPVREVAAELIRSFGFHVLTAGDGATGIAKFRENPASFDVVLLDLTMPGMDGEQTLAALREMQPDVRVLLASGYGGDDRLLHLASGGPMVFLQKPFTRGQLQAKLRELLP